jgi:prepilin-type N-terminal cleavage/methylation domain-containing protein
MIEFDFGSPTLHTKDMLMTLARRFSKKQLGFTLLELLVVISIIGILIGLSAVSYTTAQKRGRDARRTGDLKAMQSVYEQFYADPVNSYSYPADCSSTYITDYAPAGWPVDPKNSDEYIYTKTCEADNYCFCALMEGAQGNSSLDGDDNGGDCSGLGLGTEYFCVKHQQ